MPLVFQRHYKLKFQISSTKMIILKSFHSLFKSEYRKSKDGTQNKSRLAKTEEVSFLPAEDCEAILNNE